jgi:hypothetical protein
MATYDSLHRQCRTLESLFDSKLTSYSRLAASISRAGTNEDIEAGPSWREAESEVEDLLEKVRCQCPCLSINLGNRPGRIAWVSSERRIRLWTPSLMTQTILLRNPCYVQFNVTETCTKTTAENFDGQRYVPVHNTTHRPSPLFALSNHFLGCRSDSRHIRQMSRQPSTKQIYLAVCATT